MAEPQPASATEGMDDPQPPEPATAEDRKTQAAMKAVESRTADNDEDNQKPSNKIDGDALNKAISRLELAEKAGTAQAVMDPDEGRRQRKEEERKEKERRAKIKVDVADVSLLVEECDLSKGKATDLLRAHEGNIEHALKAFVRAWG